MNFYVTLKGRDITPNNNINLNSKSLKGIFKMEYLSLMNLPLIISKLLLQAIFLCFRSICYYHLGMVDLIRQVDSYFSKMGLLVYLQENKHILLQKMKVLGRHDPIMVKSKMILSISQLQLGQIRSI